MEGKDHPDFDPDLNAIVQKDAHKSIENQALKIKKQYHTYDVEALEDNVKKIEENIAMFHQHIVAEEEQKKELLDLIAEGKERDRLLMQLLVK